ncbi:MAG: 30S ribosomal protein S16 [Candidatus Paceibacterota bacterium]
MLKIRLQRFGRKNEPVFRVVLTDSKNSTKSGKFLENLGNYDARRGEDVVIKSDRISYWVSKGAKLSDTLNNLLVSKKIIEGKKINNLPKKKPILKEVTEEVKKAGEVKIETPVEAPVSEEAIPGVAPEVATSPKTEEVPKESKVETKTEEVKPEEASNETPVKDVKEDSEVA